MLLNFVGIATMNLNSARQYIVVAIHEENLICVRAALRSYWRSVRMDDEGLVTGVFVILILALTYLAMAVIP